MSPREVIRTALEENGCAHIAGLGIPSAILAALDAAGLVVVPKEPTPHMLAVASDAQHAGDVIRADGVLLQSGCRVLYRAMLRAAGVVNA